MSDEVEKAMKAKTPIKKRSLYQEKSLLDLPQWAKDDKAHKYRWVSTRRIGARSDDFDPRGWSTAKDPVTGETLKAYDVILSRTPLDEHEKMLDYKNKEKDDFVKHLTENMDSQSDRLRYEIERLGGSIGKIDFSIGKNNNNE